MAGLPLACSHEEEQSMTTFTNRLSSASIVILGVSCLALTPFCQTNNSDKNKLAGADSAKTPASFSVKVTGHGAPMILIPGLSSSGDTWKSTVTHFQDRYTCHVLTLAGFAGEPPIHAPLLATVREDLASYIQQHHLQKPVVMGHSLGGTIALDLAANHPDLVGPLVIVDSLPFMAGAWFQVKTLDEAKPMIAGMKGYMDNQTREQYDGFVRSGAATKYMVTSAADLQTLIQWGLSSDPKTVSGAMIELISEDLRPELENIKSRTLVLGTWAGLRDQMQQNGIQITKEAVTKTFQEQYANLRGLDFSLAENARHFIMWDDPNWFFQQLDGFLAGKSAKEE
jgi:N-formylmaleamate deformylase